MNSRSQCIEKLVILEQELFTGVVTIIGYDDRRWNIYIYQGMLLWVEGGFHVYRFWQRHLSQICPQNSSDLFEKERTAGNSTTDYYFINTLSKQKLASRKQINQLITQKLEETFFDIFQVENKHRLKITHQIQSAHSLLKKDFNLTLQTVSISELLLKVYAAWSTWAGKGLSSCSPNLAPLLKQDTKIDQQVSSLIFNNMQRMLNGQKTLRDLALQMNKSVFDVTCALVPYFFKGYIRLIEIPDLPGVNLSSDSLSSAKIYG